MLKMTSLYVFLWVLVYCCRVNGLECYQCYHSTDSSARNDQNCDKASKIYRRDCTTPINLPKEFQKYLTTEKYSFLSVNNADKKKNVEFSCMVIDVQLYNSKDSFTVRGCTLKNDTGFDDSSSSSTFKTHIYICNSNGCNDPHTGFTLESICKYFIYVKRVLLAAGFIGGAVGAVVAAPVVIGAAGFTAGGVAAGSVAATAQAGMAGTVAAGGLFATLQSIGVAGFSFSSNVIIGAVGATVLGTMLVWFVDIYNSTMCN